MVGHCVLSDMLAELGEYKPTWITGDVWIRLNYNAPQVEVCVEVSNFQIYSLNFDIKF